MNSYKYYLSVFFLLLNLSLFAQFDKVDFVIEKGQYKKALKLAENYLEDPQLKKEFETYAAHAWALYSYYVNDEFYAKDNPNAVRQAVKSLQKGIKRVEGLGIEEFEEVINDIVKENNKMGDQQFAISKYSKAFSDYESSYELTNDAYAHFSMSKCKLLEGDTTEAEDILGKIMYSYQSDSAITKEKVNEDVYIYFINKHWNEGDLERAQSYLSEVRSIIGESAKIDFYQKNVAMDKLKKLQPGSILLEYLFDIQEVLPLDKELIHKENAAFFFLIRQQIENNNVIVDSTIQLFTDRKIARAKSPDKKKYVALDEYVDDKTENIIWKMSEYYLNFNHSKAASYFLQKYITSTQGEKTEIERWNLIANYAYKNKGLPFSLFILQEAIKKFPNDKELLNLRRKFLDEQANKRLNTVEYGALYKLAKDEYKLNKSDDNRALVIKCNNNFFDLLIRDNKMKMAKEVMEEEERMFGPVKDMDIKRMILARDDFNKNYFDSRVKMVSPDGTVNDMFQWDGSDYECKPGKISKEIQQKVEDRINYFRRNAGVPEIKLDDETNEYCQAAALMMQANNKLSHNPDGSWKCFSDEGAYAAQYTLMVKGNHTTTGVTSLMADNENESLGNRRWILYPKSLYYGHGSTPDYTVVWALDDSGSKDTSHYMENPICWPPKGYIPNSMIFKHFSFGLYQDLTNAKVEVIHDGVSVNVDVKPFVRGYGVPTLVFTPDIPKESLKERNLIDITITLKNGKKFKYTVNPFEYNPNR